MGSTFPAYWKYGGGFQKKHIGDLLAKLAAFFFFLLMEHHLNLKVWLADILIIQTLMCGRCFLRKEQSEPITLSKTDNVCCQW